MRFTRALCKQNIGRQIKWQWRAQRRKTLVDTNAERALAARGVPVVDANEFVRDPLLEAQKRTDVAAVLASLVGPVERPPAFDSSHPLWHDRPCLVYGDHSVPVHGLEQAQVFTNSVMAAGGGLPRRVGEQLYEAYRLPGQDERVRGAVAATLLFDAVQEKLPVRKDPARPAWKFPREYGVPDARRNGLMVGRMLQLCESGVGGMSSGKLAARDAVFRVPLRRADRVLSLNVRADLLLLADEPLPPHDDAVAGELPDLFPLDSTISLEETNVYAEDEFVSPVPRAGRRFSNVHTAYVHFDETEVKNLYGTPVLETQVLGRSLMKSYAFAVAAARSKYGEDVRELPEPVTLQCVQTNSRWFHFSIFQLNGLAGPGEQGPKNYYWQTPLLDLYDRCDFERGVPVLEGYNPEVFKHFLSFYMNGTEYEIK